MTTAAPPVDLVGRIAAGDEVALMELYDDTAPVVLRLARLCAGGDEEAARRATCAAYLALWRQAPDGALAGPDGLTPTTWLLGAVHQELRGSR